MYCLIYTAEHFYLQKLFTSPANLPSRLYVLLALIFCYPSHLLLFILHISIHTSFSCFVSMYSSLLCDYVAESIVIVVLSQPNVYHAQRAQLFHQHVISQSEMFHIVSHLITFIRLMLQALSVLNGKSYFLMMVYDRVIVRNMMI